jgi:chemotaxis methyl-accepting protein methylase
MPIADYGPSPYTLTSQPFLPEPQRAERLNALLCPGDLGSPTVARQLQRLAEAFEQYRAHFPYGAWRQGLVVTAEMHRWTEWYLPLVEVWRIWRTIVSAALKQPATVEPEEFLGMASWLAILDRCRQAVPMAPHLILEQMLQDAAFRQRMLFAWYVPEQHGGGFNRYPEQLAWLREWLLKRRRQGQNPINCLDAGCGSGEGTYELAAAALGAGYAVKEIRVVGTTLQPLAVAAAAMCHFPHAETRQAGYQRQIRALLPLEMLERITFRQEDLLSGSQEVERYHLIQCNGLLGGPLLFRSGDIGQVLAGLVQRLHPGGILVADDRFHGGWRQRVPLQALRQQFINAGLQLVPISSGVCGVRAGVGY